MSVIQHRATRRLVVRLAISTAVAAIASPAFGQVSSLNLNFNGGGGGYAQTGFDAAYNPDPAGFNLNLSGNGRLGIRTNPGDTYGGYETDPDNAKNFFYSSFNVGDRAVLEAKVNALNLNSNFHGGGIWMGTDEDHYIRLGLIYNSFEGGATVEALRENEDRWNGDPDGPGSLPALYPTRPGFDLEGRNLGIDASATPTVGGATGGRDVTATLRLVRDHHAVAAYISLDNGVTFTRLGDPTYSFNALTTDATSLPIDNRTVANPNNPDKTSSSVEGGFKVGAYALGGGSSAAVVQFDSLTAITGTPTYTGSASGEWTTGANWNNNNGIGAPTNIESTAVFPTAATARTLTVATDITATNIRFDSASGTTVNGPGAIRLDWFFFPTHPDYYTDGPGTVTVTAGSHTINAPTLVAHLHNFDVAAGATLTLTNMTASPVDNLDAGVRKLSAGTMVVNRLLTSNVDVQAGTLRVASNGTATGVSNLRTISVVTTAGSTARFDLTNNAAVLEYADAASTPLTAITALVTAGYNVGTFNGAGIISSSAASDARFGIGIAEASEIGTVPALFGTVDTTALLLRYTYKGDANLDGTVNFADLLTLAQNFNAPMTRWRLGDFNYDTRTDFADLLSLAQNFSNSLGLTPDQLSALGADFGQDWALAQSLAPEPTTLAGLALLATAGVRRRRPAR